MKTFLLAALLALPAPAATKVIQDMGKPIEIFYDDGRVAAVFGDQEMPHLFDIPLGIYENICNDITRPKCRYRASARVDRYVVRWTKHPVPEKVGQILKSKNPDGSETTMSEFHFNFSSGKYAGGKFFESFPDDLLICDSFEWLPAKTVEAPQNLLIPRWDCELMQTNPETGLTENRIFASAVELPLEKNAEGQLVLRRPKAFGGTVTLFQANVIGLTMQDGPDYCSISLKPDFSKTTSELIGYISGIKDDWTPVLQDGDKFTDSSVITSFLKYPDNGDPQ